MSTEARVGNLAATEWDGGALPYRVGHRKLGMWLFIVSDAMTFTAMLIGTLLGERLLLGLPVDRFRRIVSALIGLLGLWLLVSSA